MTAANSNTIVGFVVRFRDDPEIIDGIHDNPHDAMVSYTENTGIDVNEYAADHQVMAVRAHHVIEDTEWPRL